MKIFFLNRCKGEFWSIEELFQNICRALPDKIISSVQFAPRRGASFGALIGNLKWSRSFKATDLIHVTGDVHYAVLSVKSAPVVLTIHDLRFIEVSRGLKRMLFWLFWLYLPAKRCARITVISEFTKDRLIALCPIPHSKVSVIPNCVSPEFQPKTKPWNSERPSILHVGTTENKNLERVAGACSGLEITIWVLGRLTSDQHQLLATHRIEYREHHGLSREEVVSLYEKCDIVSFVSTYEGFGLPILEAQAVGRPLLTSNISPMRDVAGTGALLVNPFEVESIREGLLRLLADSALREQLVADGFANVANYSAKAVAAQYAALYQDVLAHA